MKAAIECGVKRFISLSAIKINDEASRHGKRY